MTRRILPFQALAVMLAAAVALVSAPSRAQEIAATPIAAAPGMGAGSDALSEPSGAAGFGSSVPIQVPSFLGIEPAVSLSYNSSGGDGIVGVGWSLTAGSSIRVLSQGHGMPWLDGAHDEFVFDGEALYPCASASGAVVPGCANPSGSGAGYYTRVDHGVRIERMNEGWTVWTQDGVKRVYSETQTSPDGHVTTWLLTTVTSPLAPSQPVQYRYTPSGDPIRYLAGISYNGHLVNFLYESRLDVRPVAVAGGATALTRYRLKAIDVLNAATPDALSRVRAYGLTYQYSGATGRSLLKSVEQLSKDASVTVVGPGVVTFATGSVGLPATRFSYESESAYGLSTNTIGTTVPTTQATSAQHLGDFSGAASAIQADSAWKAVTMTLPPGGASVFQEMSSLTADFDGNGATDIVFVANVDETSNILIFALADGRGGWNVSSQPIPGIGLPLVGDSNGDGIADLMVFNFTSDGTSWHSYMATFDTASNKMLLFDGNQTGVPTTIIPGPAPVCNVPTNYAGDPSCIPGDVRAPRMVLADVSGDGIADLVSTIAQPPIPWATNTPFVGTVVEWRLGLGDGRFGPSKSVSFANNVHVPIYGESVIAGLFDTTVTPGDLNADGRIDFVLTGYSYADYAAAVAKTPDLVACPLLAASLQTPAGLSFQMGACLTLGRVSEATARYATANVSLADLDGDGRKDLVIPVVPLQDVPAITTKCPTTRAGSGVPAPLCDLRVLKPASTQVIGPRQLMIVLAKGQGNLGTPTLLADPRVHTYLSQVVDIDGDGREDLVDPSNGEALLSRTTWTGPAWKYRAATAFGAFSSDKSYGFGDTDGDGIPEAVAWTLTSGTGGNSATIKASTLGMGSTGNAPSEWLRGDVDGDGFEDRVRVITPAAYGAQTELWVSTQLRRVDPTTGAVSWVPAATQQVSLPRFVLGTTARIIDPNGQGKHGLLFITPNAQAGTVTFTQAQFGGGTWSALPSWTATLGAGEITESQSNWFVGDVTGDGKPDAVQVIASMNTVVASTFDFSAQVAATASVPITDTYVNAERRRWIALDANGDGAMDLASVRDYSDRPRDVITLLSDRQKGFVARISNMTAVKPIPPSAWRAADLNGDGTADLVAITSAFSVNGETGQMDPGAHMIVLDLEGHGDGTYANRNFLAPYVESSSWTRQNTLLADLDGDGRTDLVTIPPNYDPAYLESGLQYIGFHFARSDASGNGDALFRSTWHQAGGAPNNARWAVVDDNCDGHQELEYDLTIDATGSSAGAISRYNFRRRAGYDAVTSVVRPLGGETRVAYDTAQAPSGAAPLFSTPTLVRFSGASAGGLFARTITTDAHTANGSGRGKVMDRTFHSPVWQANERRFLGFRSMFVTESALNDDGSTGPFPHRAAISVASTFSLGDMNSPPTDTSYACGLRPTAVMTQGADESDRPVLTQTSYADPGAGPLAAGVPFTCRPVQSTMTTIGATASLTSATKISYDTFGQVAYTETTAGGTTVTSFVHRAIAAGSYVVAPTEQSTWSGTRAAPGATLRRTTLCYDTPLAVDRANPSTALGACAGPSGAGRVTGVLVHCLNAECASPLSITTSDYDDGSPLPTSTTDPNGVVSRVVYSDPFPVQLRSVQVTRAYGTPQAKTLTTSWDQTFGLPNSVTDPVNRVRTQTSYDGFGRSIAEQTILDFDLATARTISSSSTQYVARYDFTSWAGTHSQHMLPDGTFQYADAAVDGLGRTYYTDHGTVDAEGKDAPVAAFTFFGDDSSLPYRTSLPTFTAGDAPRVFETSHYSAFGRPLSVTHADGTSSSVAYDVRSVGSQAYLVTTAVDEAGHARCTATDALGRLIRRTDSDDCTSASSKAMVYSYNDLGEVTGVVDPLGNLTSSASWDTMGRKLSATDPDNGTHKYVYDPAGNVLRDTHMSVATGGGETVLDAIDSTYDALGRTLTIINSTPDTSGALTPARTMSFVYDESDGDATGSAGASFFGFGSGRMTSVYDSAFASCDDPASHGTQQRALRIKYDATGNELEQWRCVDEDKAYSMSHSYLNNRRLASTTYSDGETVTYGYDHASRPISSVSSLSNVTTTLLADVKYNELEQPTRLALGNGVTQFSTYDPTNFRMLSTVVSGSVRTGSVTSPGVVYASAYGYYNDGQIRTQSSSGPAAVQPIVNGSGSSGITNARSVQGKLYSGGGSAGNSGANCLANYSFPVTAGGQYTVSTVASFTGDTYLKVGGACVCANDDSHGGLGSECTCTASVTGTAELCASSYGLAAASWNYTVVEGPTDTGSGGNGQSGAVCLGSYPFQVTAGSTYTVSTVASFTGDTYLQVGGACACVNDDSHGGLGSECSCTATATGTATICASSYSTSAASWHYTVSVSGAVEAGSVDFTYDARHHLTTVVGARNESFQYDDLGRMTSSTTAAGTSTFNYPGGVTPALLHATTAGTTPAGAFTASYDAAGQLKTVTGGGADRTYTWDGLGQLSAVATGGNNVSFAYAADAARVQKIENGLVTYYPFAEEEIDSTGNLIKSYYVGGTRIARRSALDALAFYHTDHLGSTVAMTDASGTFDPSSGTSYGSFGTTGATPAASTGSVLFTGAKQEPSTGGGGGLVYLQARYYDPVLQRFISPDSIVTGTNAMGFNRYAYADQDPVNNNDPSGHVTIAPWQRGGELGGGSPIHGGSVFGATPGTEGSWHDLVATDGREGSLGTWVVGREFVPGTAGTAGVQSSPGTGSDDRSGTANGGSQSSSSLRQDSLARRAWNKITHFNQTWFGCTDQIGCDPVRTSPDATPSPLDKSPIGGTTSDKIEKAVAITGLIVGAEEVAWFAAASSGIRVFRGIAYGGRTVFVADGSGQYISSGLSQLLKANPKVPGQAYKLFGIQERATRMGKVDYLWKELPVMRGRDFVSISGPFETSSITGAQVRITGQVSSAQGVNDWLASWGITPLRVVGE